MFFFDSTKMYNNRDEDPIRTLTEEEVKWFNDVKRQASKDISMKVGLPVTVDQFLYGR